MEQVVRVAAAQITPITFDMGASVSKMSKYIDMAADYGAQLVVFGEMCAGGFPGWRPPILKFGDQEFFKSETTWASKKLFAISEVIPGRSSKILCEKARERKIHVITGFAEADETIKGTIYNSSLLISDNGTVLGKHRKMHIGSLEYEYWKRGDASDVKVFPTTLGKLGLVICYDAVFPEYTRLLDLMGEDIQCQMWAASSGYETATIHCPIVRALEGGIFVIAACVVGKDELTGLEYTGGSQIVDPFGRVLAKANDGKEELIMADLNMDLIVDYRTSGTFSLGMDRRDDVYRLSLLNRTDMKD
jgi:predicted amidohydrolase